MVFPVVTRWLTLPRGSGPALRVHVVAVNGARRRRVMLRLLEQGWAACRLRVLFGLTPSQFAKVRSRLIFGDGFFKPTRVLPVQKPHAMVQPNLFGWPDP